MTEERRSDGAATPGPARTKGRALAALDAVIAAYSAVGLIYLASGGFDLGMMQAGAAQLLAGLKT